MVASHPARLPKGAWYNLGMTEFVQITTTTPTEQQADQIARALVNERLAACVQITGPTRSVYRWEGKVEQAAEWLCVAKTRKSLCDAVKQKICELHTYECPEVIATPIIDGNKDYFDWLADQLL